jgi:hypothetical protein
MAKTGFKSVDESIPVKLLETVAKFRAKEVADREKVKAAAPKRARPRYASALGDKRNEQR